MVCGLTACWMFYSQTKRDMPVECTSLGLHYKRYVMCMKWLCPHYTVFALTVIIESWVTCPIQESLGRVKKGFGQQQQPHNFRGNGSHIWSQKVLFSFKIFCCCCFVVCWFWHCMMKRYLLKHCLKPSQGRYYFHVSLSIIWSINAGNSVTLL